ncbi:NADPH:quinone reductase [Actinomadura sp. ATCC 31491]|uniref:NADPH:quinone reductase n=1 Tax=Actinomadura luzonensis TaxID=2805427 RepID=A0ABT0FM21_9ACTN|nr:NADPH:quinone reductase [Actinomadura luzonensis]MCK2213384.1 NADPH:quinone reductase [Actinomadura luzonensis]
MRAVWYDRTGPAADVLTVGELPDPEPAAGEVRVRVRAAGVNPADVKRRQGAGDRVMRDPRVIPGDDGAGVIDRVGPRVPTSWIGRRVWVHSANHGRPYGTSAEYVVVPAAQAVELPANTSFEAGACLGVPALTAHRCLFADGPVAGRTVLVTGAAGAVGHYAVQLAAHGGATVIATARTPEQRASALDAGAHHVLDNRAPGAAEAVLDLAPAGVDRVVDVAFGANLPFTSQVIATGGTIATYASDAVPEPALPFYRLMRRGVTIRTTLVFVMPAPALRAATEHVTRLLEDDVLTHPIAARHPLAAAADAHRDVESGHAPGKVLILP